MNAIPLPHAIVRNLDGKVVNICSWDRVAEWQPEPGHVAILLDGPIPVNIGDVYNFASKTFGASPELIKDKTVLLLPDGSVYKSETTETTKQEMKISNIPSPEKILGDQMQFGATLPVIKSCMKIQKPERKRSGTRP